LIGYPDSYREVDGGSEEGDIINTMNDFTTFPGLSTMEMYWDNIITGN